MSPKTPTVGEHPFETLGLYALGCRSWPDGAVRVSYLRFLVGFVLCLVWPASHRQPGTNIRAFPVMI